MKIPPGHTEQSVLAAVDKAASILAPSFVFGSYELDDVRQHCYLAAIKALEAERYNPELPLENFLYTSIRNALINLKREYRRSDAPCPACHAGAPCAAAVDGSCPKYRAWHDRNQRRANVASPLAIDSVSDERESRARTESTVETDAEIGEILRLVDEHLPVELRQTYLQMRAGVSVPKGKRLQVERAVKDILKGEIECPSEDD